MPFFKLPGSAKATPYLKPGAFFPAVQQGVGQRAHACRSDDGRRSCLPEHRGDCRSRIRPTARRDVTTLGQIGSDLAKRLRPAISIATQLPRHGDQLLPAFPLSVGLPAFALALSPAHAIAGPLKLGNDHCLIEFRHGAEYLSDQLGCGTVVKEG